MNKINYIILTLCLLIILIFTIINIHPIFLTVRLLVYTSLICIIISIWSFNFIYSIITFLIIIRGLLIIFIYFSRLIANEKNKITINIYILLSLLLNYCFILVNILFNNFKLSIPLNFWESSTILYTLNSWEFKNILIIYNYPFINITLICIIFLLISLFIIIKISSIKFGSLRKIN